MCKCGGGGVGFNRAENMYVRMYKHIDKVLEILVFWLSVDFNTQGGSEKKRSLPPPLPRSSKVDENSYARRPVRI